MPNTSLSFQPSMSRPRGSRISVSKTWLHVTWALNMHEEKKHYLWDIFWFACTKNYIEFDSKRSKSEVYRVLRKSSFSHFSSWENDFPVVKSGVWGHISIFTYVLNWPFPHWSCSSSAWNENLRPLLNTNISLISGPQKPLLTTGKSFSHEEKWEKLDFLQTL